MNKRIKGEEENNPLYDSSKKHQITHIIRENSHRPIPKIDVKSFGTEEDEGGVRDLLLTLGGDSSSVYEGKHLDLASHFMNEPNEYCKSVGNLTTGCWVSTNPSINDAVFVLGSDDGVVSVISLADSKVIKRFETRNKIVDLVSNDQLLNTFASLGVDSSNKLSAVIVWDCLTGVKTSEISLSGEFKSVQLLIDYTLLITSSDEILQYKNNLCVEKHKLPFKASSAKVLNEDKVVLLSTNGSICIFDSKTKEKILPAFPTKVKLSCMNKSNCNRYLVAGNDQGCCFIVDLQTSNCFELKSPKTKGFNITSLSFSNGINQVICSSSDGLIWRWVLKEIPSEKKNILLQEEEEEVQEEVSVD